MSSIVSDNPYMTFGDYDMFRGGSVNPSWVDTHHVTWETEDSFADNS